MTPRVWLLFACLLPVSAQYPRAFLRFDLLPNGVQHAMLDVSSPTDGPIDAPIDAGAFARAVGCDARDVEPQRYSVRTSVQCAAARPSPLRMEARIDFSQIKPILASAGVSEIALSLSVPTLGDASIQPAIGSRDGAYSRGSFRVDQLPAEVRIDAGFNESYIRTLGAGIGGLLLLTFLLLIRVCDLAQLYALVHAVFVAGWAGWTWVLIRTQAWLLCDLASGNRWTAPLLLVGTPLAAVWIGSQFAAMQYSRIASRGADPDAYRRTKFWIGAAIVFFYSSICALFAFSTDSLPVVWSMAGIVAAVLCILQLRRSARGSSHALADGPLRQRAFALASQAGVRLRGVTILTSSANRPPAAFATRWGAIMLNESLLRKLSRREVDAVICHEFSHLNPARRAGMVVIYVAMVATVMGAQLAPGLVELLPLAIIATVLLYKAWRRSEEFKADADSVRWSRDPESLISGLARVSANGGMPLEWKAPVAWMIGHPSTMRRLQAIAAAGNIPSTRIPELIATASAEAADHYEEASVGGAGDAFSPALKKQMQSFLTLYALAAPAIFGTAAGVLLNRAHLDTLLTWILGSAAASIAFYLGYEWVVGGMRARMRVRAVQKFGDGIFAGFSPASEPRVFDGSYHYDCGIVKISGDVLEFAGDRTKFTLYRRLVTRVRMGPGPRHWTPRTPVYIEYRRGDEVATISLQSFEARFWPGTTHAARKLFGAIEDWRTNGSQPVPPPLPCNAPVAEGTPDTSIAFAVALKGALIQASLGFLLVTLGGAIDVTRPFDFSVPLICASVAIFACWPRMIRRRT